MSKASHAKHEHQQDSCHDPVLEELEAMEASSFAHRHKALIWVVIIGMFIMFPIVYGVLAVLNAF